MHIFKNTNYDFLRWRWHAIALSWIVIIAGMAVLITRGIPKGVEFAGGTVVIEQFDRPATVQQVRSVLDRFFPALECPRVRTDDVRVGEMATQHLIDLGHTRIAHIRGPQVSVGRLRFEGYQRALQRRAWALEKRLRKLKTRLTGSILG